MATNLTDHGTVYDKVVSFPIEKSRTTVTPDGDMYVYGKCTDGGIDSDEQIVDPEWSAEALSKWFSTGANVRKQHSAKDPVGKGIHIELNRDNDGGHYLRAEVVDRDAQRLVQKGVLQAFSVGIMKPKVFAHNKARGGIIKGGDIGEVSLVDRPANSGCAFSLVKAADSGEAEYSGTLMAVDRDWLFKQLATPLAMPRVQQGMVPAAPPSGMFADPVANKLNDALTAEKRDFSAAQRRSAAGSGAAMPDGSFPIKNGEDLDNAIHLAGHGKNPAAARAHIRERAAAIGQSDKIPTTWSKKSDGSEDTSDLTSDLTEELVKQVTDGLVSIDEARKALGLSTDDTDTGTDADPEKGMKCGTCSGSGMMSGKPCPDCCKKAEDEPDAAKGKGKPMPPSAGAGDDEDDDDTEGDGDGGKAVGPPSASNSSKRPRNIRADATSGAKPAKPVTDSSPDDDQASGSGGRNYAGNKAQKSEKYACSACGCKAAKMAAFCAGCGAEFAGKRNDPAAGVRNKKPTDALPSHREPDGNVQNIEADAGLPSSKEKDGRDAQLNSMGWDSSGKPPGGSAILDGSGTMAVGGGNSTSIARKGDAPYSLTRAHDAFCPAYSEQTILNEYPSLGKLLDAVDAADLRETASKALGDDDFDLGEALLAVARYAAGLVKAEAEVIADARAEMHKSFTDMYPSAHPTPGSVSPGMFQRSYISEGHAPGSAVPMGMQPPAKIPPTAPPASSYNRGPITAGQERPSPGGSKGHAMKAMEAIHDNLAALYPDMCPFGAEAVKAGGPQPDIKLDGAMTPEDVTKAVQDALAQAGYPVSTPQPTEAYVPQNLPEVQQGRPVASLVKAGKKAKTGALKQDGFRAEDLAEIVKSAIAPVAETVESLREAITSKDTQISELEKQVTTQGELIDKLGAMPDPAQAPNRGVVLASLASPGGARPAMERRSGIAEAAEKAQEEKLEFLRSFMQSGDPGLRMQAEEQISKMLSAS